MESAVNRMTYSHASARISLLSGRSICRSGTMVANTIGGPTTQSYCIEMSIAHDQRQELLAY